MSGKNRQKNTPRPKKREGQNKMQKGGKMDISMDVPPTVTVPWYNLTLRAATSEITVTTATIKVALIEQLGLDTITPDISFRFNSIRFYHPQQIDVAVYSLLSVGAPIEYLRDFSTSVSRPSAVGYRWPVEHTRCPILATVALPVFQSFVATPGGVVLIDLSFRILAVPLPPGNKPGPEVGYKSWAQLMEIASRQ